VTVCFEDDLCLSKRRGKENRFCAHAAHPL
jgi:hypothetical protein